MARFWFRTRRHRATLEPRPPASDAARLDGAEHAWWAQRDVDGVWTPRPSRQAAADAEAERDILADHFGEDWRTSFGFTSAPDATTPEAEPLEELPPLVETDPYTVLEVDPSATWEEIVSAHRHQARVHHPDRLFGQSPEEIARGEERIRVVNSAYQELRVRRGK